MRLDRAAEAITLLEPLASSPHGGATVEAAKTLIEQARAGEAPLDAAALDAAAEADEEAPPQPEPAPPSGGFEAEPSNDAGGGRATAPTTSTDLFSAS